MALIEKKRSRKDMIPYTRKRQRVSHVDEALKKIAGVTSRNLDTLPWNKVALPDRLDDAEGFFGLEELSDVEIVRDTNFVRVQHKLKRKSIEDSSEKAKDDTFVVHDHSVDRIEDEDEWVGLEATDCKVEDSSEVVKKARKASSSKSMSKAVRKAEAKLEKRRKQQDKLRSAKDSQNLATNKNAFDVLGEESDEEGDGKLGYWVDLVEYPRLTMLVSAWDSLGLSSETLSSLARLKFSVPTPIQASAIPEILRGHDVVGKAATGSGKTLAFGIPIVEHYLKSRHSGEVHGKNDKEDRPDPPTALVLSPTRELAHQLSTHLKDLCFNFTSAGPAIITVTGGLSLQKQQRLLVDADIIIGTPGRLWEIINASAGLEIWLKRTEFLVVDEADRLLSEGHFKEVEEILSVLDRSGPSQEEGSDDESQYAQTKGQRQTLVFSATFQKDLQQKLAGKGKSQGSELLENKESLEYLLKKLRFREAKPKLIDVNPISPMASGLKEGIVECAGLDKDLYLYSLLMHHPNTRTLIFTNSIASVRRLTPFLQNLNVPAYALHSQMPQKARLRSIERFSSHSSPGSILVATDVAARGLDIPSIQLIIHYHLPRAADMYVHRSGRTARAERSGSSILLCAPEEVVGVRRLVAKVHARNSNHESDASDKKYFMRTIELDRRVIARLKPRVTLSKKISDASLAKEKKGHEENWLRTAAEDLGVDYDSEEFAAGEASKKGRGQGRKKAEKDSRSLTKGEVGALRGELKEKLAQRVNVGVSERYLTAGGVDVDELLREGKRGEFLGRADGGLGDW